MKIFQDIHHTINEEDRLIKEMESLMVERDELLANRFSIMEIEYNPDGSVEWNPEQAKPPAGGGGITRDTGPGVQRRKAARTTPRVADVVLTTNEQGQVLPAIITDLDQRNGIIQNRKAGLKRKIDMTTLRQAQGDVAKRFATKYPDRTFWQIG